MAIADDFSVAVNGDIRHVSGSTTYTVLEFHRWLQDLADDAAAGGNDLVDITSATPSERSTDNIITLLGDYNIDDDAAEYLYDGSITQGSGPTLTRYSGLVVVGSIASTTTLKVVQANTFYDSQASPFWGTGLNEDPTQNILLQILVKTTVDGVPIDGGRVRIQARTYGDTYAEFSLTLGLGNSTAAIFTNTDLNNQTASGTVATWTINNTEGFGQIDINNDSTDEDYYSAWDRVASAGGNGNINDVYEWAKYLARAGTASTIHSMNGELFRGITHSLAYDLEGGGITVATNDTLVWGTNIYCPTNSGTFTVGEAVHEDTATPAWTGYVLAWDAANDYLMILLTSGTVSVSDTFTGKSSSATGTVTSSEAPQSGSAGGMAHVLAVEDLGTTGKVWIQLLKGLAPVDNTRMYDSADLTDYIDVDGSPTSRTVTPCFLGTSTGSNLIGAYGIGVVTGDTSVGDQYFDLDDNGPILPPNNQSFVVGGLITGEDRVLVGPKDVGNDIEFDQFTTNGVHTNASTTVTVTSSIPSDTPSTGTIRIQDNNGIYQRMTYTGWTGTTFTGCTGSGTWTSADASNLFISYLDVLASGATASYTAVYSSDRSLWVRVRDGGSTPIKTFQTAATYGSGGGSVTAIRTPDA
jgi:hypothetical protein